MTMLSFRVSEAEAAVADEVAAELGIARSDLLRDALHRRLVELLADRDALRWEAMPADGGESSFASIADWGPAEEWTDWESWSDEAG